MRALISALLLAAQLSEPKAIDLLLRQARYWQARGREDKAAEAFEKVLRSDPREPEALCALGAQAARLGQLDKARELFERLKAVAPGSADAHMLERAIAVGSDFDKLLATARSLSRGGKTDEAAAAYRKLFGDEGAPRHLAVEYYSTLGGTRDGWKESREGLQNLVKQSPGEPLYRLVLGKLLTYREETRREGIGVLSKLVEEGGLAAEADQALRQALLWLRLVAGDEPLLSAYLVRHPDDAEVKKRLAEPRPDVTRQGTVAAGYEALEKSDVKEAERLFKSASRADSSADTLVGQALVAMRKQEFAKARDLLARVKTMAPGRADLWDRSLRSATFWALMQDGHAAQAAGHLEEAESVYASAGHASAEERPHAELALADLALSAGQVEKAELRIRALLREKPDMPEALRALLDVVIRTDHADEAQNVNEKLRKLQPRLALSNGALEAEMLRWRSAGDAARGRYDIARQGLLAARNADPQSRWALYDLANLDLKLGDLAGAREATLALLKLDPGMPEARVTWIRLLGDESDNEGALTALSALPPEMDTIELRDFRPLLEVRAEAQRIVRRASYDRRELVRDDLLRLQQRVRGKPEVSAAVARAWAALGEHQRAVDLMSDAVSQSQGGTPALKLDLAAILLKAGQETQVMPLLAELDADPRLSPRERKGLTDLKVAVAVRRSDRRREMGDLAAAFNQLAAPLNEMPDDPYLLCALGRVFLDGDRADDARALFLRLVGASPDNIEARQGAVQAAVQLRRLSEARELVGEGVDKTPREPRMRLLAARYHVQLGEDGDAMTELGQARSLLAAQAPEAASRGARLTQDSSISEILSVGRRAFGGPELDERRVADALDLQDQIQREIDGIQSRHTVYLSGESELRARAGEPGLSQLTVVRAPLEVGLPLGYRGRVVFGVTPTALDAAALDFTNADVARRFGTGELPAVKRPDLQLGLHQLGTSLQLGYQQEGLGVDVGSTPLGLPLTTVVGGLHLRQELGGLGFAVEVSRRAVEDSALSFGGVRDPLSSNLWGGVTRNGGRLDLGFTTTTTTYYIWGGYSALLGIGVQKNQEGAGGLGMEWSILDAPGFFLGVGLALTGLGYQYNLRFFTLGQGGYFSPQAFLNGAVPLRMRGTAGRLRWEATAAPALNWFNERRSPYFPLDPALQGRREQETDATGAPLQAFYPDRTSTAFAFELHAHLAYQLTTSLEGALDFAVHHAEDYDEVAGGLFLRYSFSRGGSIPAARPGMSR